MAKNLIPVDRGTARIPIEQASKAQLESFIRWQSSKLSQNPNSMYAAKNREQMAAAERQLEKLQRGGTAAPAPKTELVVPKLETLGAAISDAERVNKVLEDLEHNYNLISPQTRVDMLPEGFGVQVSFVRVEPDPSPDGPREVVDVSGRLMLSADSLKRIASAANLHWAHHESGVLDDRRDPLYVHYLAVGYHQNFDGTFRPVNGEVELDARDGAPLIQRIIDDAQKNEREKQKENPHYRGDGGRRRILELRTFLLRRAQTMAKCRAVVDMGVRRSYEHNELLKPFAVARLVFTGECQDPELGRELKRMHAARMLEGISAMYGQRPNVTTISRRPELHGHEAPAVGTVTDDPDALDVDLLEPNPVTF